MNLPIPFAGSTGLPGSWRRLRSPVLRLRQNERTARELNIMVQQSQEKVTEEASWIGRSLFRCVAISYTLNIMYVTTILLLCHSYVLCICLYSTWMLQQCNMLAPFIKPPARHVCPHVAPPPGMFMFLWWWWCKEAFPGAHRPPHGPHQAKRRSGLEKELRQSMEEKAHLQEEIQKQKDQKTALDL